MVSGPCHCLRALATVENQQPRGGGQACHGGSSSSPGGEEPDQRGALRGNLFIAQGLQCSSFLVMTYYLLRDYNVLPKKELGTFEPLGVVSLGLLLLVLV